MTLATLVKDTELSKLANIPVNTLRADRIGKRRIPFIKIGRAVYYDPEKVSQALAKMAVGGSAK